MQSRYLAQIYIFFNGIPYLLQAKIYPDLTSLFRIVPVMAPTTHPWRPQHIDVGRKVLGCPVESEAGKEDYEARMARYSGEHNEVEVNACKYSAQKRSARDIFRYASSGAPDYSVLISVLANSSIRQKWVLEALS